MEKGEIAQIVSLLADIHEGLCADEVSQYELAQLYDAIKQLMHETFKAEDKGMKAALATLECAARKQKKLLEERLALTN